MITGPSCMMEEPGLCLKPVFQILILHHTANLTTQVKIQENNQNSGSTERKETSDFVLIIHQYCILLKMIHRKKIQPSLLTISKMVQEVQHLSEQF